MKILHIFASDENQKFSLPYINFINGHFNSSEHSFIIFGNGAKDIVCNNNNVTKISKKVSSLILTIREINKSKIIILHGLFSPYLLLLLILNPWNIKKCNWVIWGGDLYCHILRKKTVKSSLHESCRKFVVKNMGGLVTQVRGDYELAQKWYSAKGKHYYSFMYPSNLYKEYDLKEVKKDEDKCYIQVGNSACSTNEHIEVFEKLEQYKNENIIIVCPLSYSGKAEYINKVIKEGYRIFGEDKFLPITDFMLYDKYLELLSKVDIAIFNHRRQRAIGNITTLLGLGKKVYIKEEITTWSFCIDHGLKVFSANGKFENLFEEMDENEKRKNIENIKEKFSEAKLIEDLKVIFE